MHTEIKAIVQQLFRKDDAGQVEAAELEALLLKYPYLSAARYLAAWQQYRQVGDKAQEELITAGLYLNNPLWLQWLLENHPVSPDGEGQQTAEGALTGQHDFIHTDQEAQQSPDAADAGAVSSASAPWGPENESIPDPVQDNPLTASQSVSASAYANNEGSADAAQETIPMPQLSESAQTNIESEESAEPAQTAPPIASQYETATAHQENEEPKRLDNGSEESTETDQTAYKTDPLPEANPARRETPNPADDASAADTDGQLVTDTAGEPPLDTDPAIVSTGQPSLPTNEGENESPQQEQGRMEKNDITGAAQDPSHDEAFPIVFQSYHTIDYFASQGIRLQQADLGKDRFGQQLKSFTDWLRSMKKLPYAQANAASHPEDAGRQQLVIRNAASSLEDREVYTEAMAEVWAKQGNKEKAREIYEKLSLLNPSKNTYFAAKIDQLNVV